MLKAELKAALIAKGYSKDQLDGKLKSELQDLYDQQEISTPTENAPISETKEIISKRGKEYWCADGSKISFREFNTPVGYRKPFPKAGDKIKKVGTKWVLSALMVLFCSGCSVTGPYTGTKYEIGYNNDDGVYLKAKPLVVEKVKSLFD